MIVIKDRNAGNGNNTYWKATADREYCIKTETDYLRTTSGKVRRFMTRAAAQKVIDKFGK